jgi:hypothetical protein
MDNRRHRFLVPAVVVVVIINLHFQLAVWPRGL